MAQIYEWPNEQSGVLLIHWTKGREKSQKTNQVKDDTTANQVKNTLKKLGIIFICTKKDAVININTEGVQQGAKHRLRSRTQGHKWDILQWPGQPPDVSLELHNLQLLKTKVKAQIPTNKQQQQSLTIKYFH